MNPRERILAATVFAILALWGGYSLFGSYQTTLDARGSQVEDARSQLRNAKLTVAKGRKAVQDLERLQKRSLPADPEKALSLYKVWLLTKAKASGLTVNDIKLAPRTTSSTTFNAIGYQIEATGTLTSVAAMLYEFYHSPQLHQIMRLRLQRPTGATQLQVTMEVEALCLPGAVATDTLPEGDSKRLKLASAAEYQKLLAERDLGTAYTPPRPPAPPSERPAPTAPPKFDEAELARLSGTINVGSGWQAWIHIRSTGETLHLMPGDKVKVGALEGTIESIEDRAMVLKTGDKKYRVALGESLRNGKELDANGNVKQSPATEPPKS
jgi:hypothetical protein